MNPFVAGKVILVLGGIGVFLYASGRDDALLRQVAIGMVVVAFLLRFVERFVRDRQRPPHDAGTGGQDHSR